MLTSKADLFFFTLIYFRDSTKFFIFKVLIPEMSLILPNSTPPFINPLDEISNQETLGHVPSDYAQMLLYGIFALIGLPVNISTLIYMLKRYRHAKSFLLLLHINLNISDILVSLENCLIAWHDLFEYWILCWIDIELSNIYFRIVVTVFSPLLKLWHLTARLPSLPLHFCS